jgi:hypothetical protein
VRTTTTQEAKVLASKQRQVFLRVKIADHTGALVDLTTLKGRNWVKSAEWSESADSYVATADVELHDQVQDLYLAPLMSASQLNSGGSQIDCAREILIETATMPIGVQPAASDWHKAFHGYTDEVDWEATPIKVTCRDLAGLLLQDAQIEVERQYGIWEASRTLQLGYVTQPSGAPPNGQPSSSTQFWKVTTAGTTGATEPAWPASPSPGATIADGTVVWTYQAAVAWSAASARTAGAFTANPSNALQYWQCIQTGTTGGANPFPSAPTQGQIVNDNTCKWQYYASLGGTPLETVIQQIVNDTLGAGVVALNTPAASNWFLGAFKQSRDKVFQAITALVEAAGWDLRYWFSGTEAAGDFKLTLQSVARGAGVWPNVAPAVVYTFDKSSYYSLTKCGRAVQDVRNVVSVIYPDAENLDATTGAPTRGQVTVSDATSIAAYKRRYMEIAEGATGSVTTKAMATVLANAALADLKDPLLLAEMELPFFWPVQLNDYVTAKANGVHFDTDQSVAVVSIKHSFGAPGEDGRATSRTVLGLRGMPTMGAQKHLDKESTAAAATLPLKATDVAKNLVVTQTIAGARVAFTPPRFKGSQYLTPELHVSTSSGFTPTSATLKDLGLKSAHIANDLTPGTTYRAAIVMRDQRGNVASKSAEQTFVAGYAGIAVAGASPLNVLDPAYTQNAHVYLSLTQAVANNSGNYIIPFDFAVANTTTPLGAVFDTSLHRFIARYGGTFLFAIHIYIYSTAPGDLATVGFRKNGTTGLSGSAFGASQSVPGPDNVISIDFAAAITLAAGDYVEASIGLTPATPNASNWNISGDNDGDSTTCRLAVAQLLHT